MIENGLNHSAVSEIQANTAPPVDAAVSIRACVENRKVQHRRTNCPTVEGPSNACLLDSITLSLAVLQDHEVYTRPAMTSSSLGFLARFS